MNSIFSYDSPLMQILMYIGDLIILNVLFLVSCIPIFTIGAAQAGLYTAIRVLNDKEDDSSVIAAYFRGFKSGFLTVTVSWGLLGILFLLVAFAAIFANPLGLDLWLCILPLVILGVFMSLIPAFHSKFGCTVFQLYRNVFLLIFSHPIRSLIAGLLMWVPLVMISLLQLYDALVSTLAWMTIYYSFAVLFGELLLRKPFKILVEEFNRRQEEARIASGEAEETVEEDPSKKIFSDEITG